MSQGWPLARMLLEQQRRRFDFRKPRVCKACWGRGERRRVLFWKGWRQCQTCHGPGMIGG